MTKDSFSHRFDPATFESKWQRIWGERGVFETERNLEELKKRPKFYVLDMFPYPSGAGLHVGHPEGYTATDVIARYKRQKGFHVLHPMGWDAFGLPTERAAMRENRHPAEISKEYVDRFRKQIQSLGFSYDWSREVDTTAPDYVRWTQWIFLKLYEKGLAYLAEVPVNWCPALGTVLANEEVKDGRYVETGDPVERRLMKQWMLKITAYAEALLEDLDTVDWPEGVKEMQRHWIGKSVGAEISFAVKGQKESFQVFTTRPDTLMGATYCVLAPEHPLVNSIVGSGEREAVQKYVDQARQKTDLARTDLAKEKTGVFTGAYAVHPITGEDLPIWIADYVLASYGEGAIMAVPAHDERDHAFAKQYQLPIRQVISGESAPIEEAAHTGEGSLIHSDFLDGLSVEAAKEAMIARLEEKGVGRKRVQYRLRDWLFSRQRYWGEPFPIVHLDEGGIAPMPESMLPVNLPPVDEYRPTDTGEPPLARASDEWKRVTLPDGRQGTLEFNTMPQWAGSCWYYLRYIDPQNSERFVDPELEKYWMPVDLYIGGVEHAVLHLLYARFWHKVLFDCGVVSTREPFQKLFNQGMILAYSYQDERGKYYHPSDVVEQNGIPHAKSTGLPLRSQIEKMSKSKLNVVNPEDVIERYGADAMRLYELFMGPLEQVKPWQMEGVDGVYRFLARLWRWIVDEQSGKVRSALQGEKTRPELLKLLHQTIRKVEEDVEGLRFNTAISQMMIFLNEAHAESSVRSSDVKTFLTLVAPFAPHIVEELWERMGFEGLASIAPWPAVDESLLRETEVTLVIQVNGKRRGDLSVSVDATPKEIEALALQHEAAQRYLEGKTPRRVIVVPKKIVNIVI